MIKNHVINIALTFMIMVIVMYFATDKGLVQSMLWSLFAAPIGMIMTVMLSEGPISNDAQVERNGDNKQLLISMLLGSLIFGLFFGAVIWFNI